MASSRARGAGDLLLSAKRHRAENGPGRGRVQAPTRVRLQKRGNTLALRGKSLYENKSKTVDDSAGKRGGGKQTQHVDTNERKKSENVEETVKTADGVSVLKKKQIFGKRLKGYQEKT